MSDIFTRDEVELLMRWSLRDRLRFLVYRISRYNYSFLLYSIFCNLVCVSYWSVYFLLYMPGFLFRKPLIDDFEWCLFMDCIMDEFCNSVLEYNLRILGRFEDIM